VSEQTWHVGLDTWIIQDGNYGDFCVGQIAEFALEYYAERGLTPRLAAARDAVLLDADDARYRIDAHVVDAPPGVCVVDFGVRAYRKEACPAAIGPGRVASGEIYVGIDPFDYFETLARRDGMPALIYTWRIERILQVTAPLVQVPDGRADGVWVGRDVWTADATRRHVLAVDATDAWSDVDDRSRQLRYVLCCRRLDVAPKCERSAA
jgi:hypothetical protein